MADHWSDRNTEDEDREPALLPSTVLLAPGERYGPEHREWQGIPGIERTAEGRLWTVWYSGGPGEGPGNYVVTAVSDDDGRNWSEPKLVIVPQDPVRAFDPVLWHDPRGTLWLFWAQSEGKFDGRAGVWRITCQDPDAGAPEWSPPRRLVHGVMMNKPGLLSTGEWFLPAAVWNREPFREDMERFRHSCFYISEDRGQNWTLRGWAEIPERSFDEHMVVELEDGRLWMLVRTSYGIGESFSHDRGRTWSRGRSFMSGPSTRFHILRLNSGNLLLLYHQNTRQRTNLTASISTDEGRSWFGHLLLDDRENISYPDAIETDSGTIYSIYDRDRSGAGEILLSTFLEKDIHAGRLTTGTGRLMVPVSRLPG